MALTKRCSAAPAQPASYDHMTPWHTDLLSNNANFVHGVLPSCRLTNERDFPYSKAGFGPHGIEVPRLSCVFNLNEREVMERLLVGSICKERVLACTG